MKNCKRVTIIIVLILVVTVIGAVIVIRKYNRNNTTETVGSSTDASVVSLYEATQDTLVSDNPDGNDSGTTEVENGNWELPEFD